MNCSDGWAELLARVFAVDVLSCELCGGLRRLIAQLTQAHVVEFMLTSLGLPTEAPFASLAGSARAVLSELVMGAEPFALTARQGRVRPPEGVGGDAGALVRSASLP